MDKNKHILSLIKNSQETTLEFYSNVIKRDMKLNAAILGFMSLHILPSEASGKDLLEQPSSSNHLLHTPLQAQTGNGLENHGGNDQKELPLKRLTTLPSEALGNDLIEHPSSSTHLALSPSDFPTESSMKKRKVNNQDFPTKSSEDKSNSIIQKANLIIQKANSLEGKTHSDEPENFFSRVMEFIKEVIGKYNEHLGLVVSNLKNIDNRMDKISNIIDINHKLTNKNKLNIDIEIDKIANNLWNIVKTIDQESLGRIFQDNCLEFYMGIYNDYCAESIEKDIEEICSEIHEISSKSSFLPKIIIFFDSIKKQIDVISDTTSYDDYDQFVRPELDEIHSSMRTIYQKVNDDPKSSSILFEEEINDEETIMDKKEIIDEETININSTLERINSTLKKNS